jgi:hypothetical protein
MLASIDGADIKNVKCERETTILVEQQPPQGVFYHAVLVIIKLSRRMPMLASIDGADIDWAPGMALLHASR